MQLYHNHDRGNKNINFWCLFYQNRLKIHRDIAKKLYNWQHVENTPFLQKKGGF